MRARVLRTHVHEKFFAVRIVINFAESRRKLFLLGHTAFRMMWVCEILAERKAREILAGKCGAYRGGP